MADPAQRPRRHVIVTGGSSGIGAALCRYAARAGWHVWIGYDSGAERAERLAVEIQAAHGSAAAVGLPLADSDRLRTALDSIEMSGAAPDALVLCGGPAPDVVSFTRLSPTQIRRQVEAAVVGNHALLADTWRRFFRHRGGGHVMAVLSAAAVPPPAPHMAGYVVAKAALCALLQAAAAELGRAGLRVSVIRPGYVETPMLAAFAPQLLERARRDAPSGRFSQAADIARVLMEGLQNPPPPGTVAELRLEPVGA